MSCLIPSIYGNGIMSLSAMAQRHNTRPIRNNVFEVQLHVHASHEGLTISISSDTCLRGEFATRST